MPGHGDYSPEHPTYDRGPSKQNQGEETTIAAEEIQQSTHPHLPLAPPPTPKENFVIRQSLLRDIVLNDHFGGPSSQVPTEIIDQWVAAMEPGSSVPLPPRIKGFYGGSLRYSIPIEVARGSYKYIVHEISDLQKVERYAERMLVALSLLDIEGLMETEPVLGAAALWHVALAQVRLSSQSEVLRETLRRYGSVRAKVKLGNEKMPLPARLKTRLISMAEKLDNHATLAVLNSWEIDA